MVTLQGSVKVLDFGIARAANRQQEATETGIVKGKVPYCSPEQISGEALDARSDVFSLGVVLWELLCGRWLFRRDKQLDTVMAVLQGAVPPPSTVRSDLDPRLDAVVARALERDVKKRTQSAAELRRELEALMSGPPVRLDEFMAELIAAGPARPEPRSEPSASSGNVSYDVNLETGAAAPPRPLPADPPARAAAPATPAAPRPSLLPRVVAGLGVGAALIFGVVALRQQPPAERVTAPGDAGASPVGVASSPATLTPPVVTPPVETPPVVTPPVVTPPVVVDSGTAADDAGGLEAPDAGAPRVVAVTTPPRPPEVRKAPKRSGPAPRAVPAAPGALDVSCAPWCRILVDGKDVGHVSPLVGFELAAGRHVLRVEHPPSGHSSEKALDVGAGARLKETFNLR
jgi:hypothetical protein